MLTGAGGHSHIGDRTCLRAVIGPKPYSLTAEALPGGRADVVTADEFIPLMQGDPRLALHVLQIRASEVRIAREALTPSAARALR